ncbi:uncharacterized protein LOC130932576 [Arachis stenosperma]|uniref:uncharacterized protein LOC130932576 n=1 Tax=Arachis stenosperma TaxID=217475 RepID=UPI0025AD37FA|nr:uncharacterized protein LOC130932576 [Arachis stenosperma]
MFVIAADEDIQVLFYCLRSFPKVKIHELYAKLEVGVDSSGASTPVPHSTESFLVLVHCFEKIQKSKKYGVKFTDREPLIVSTGVKYDMFVIATDEDIQLYAKLEVGVDSSGASTPVPHSAAMGGASSSMAPATPTVLYIVSSSFATDLDRTEAVGSVPFESHGVRVLELDHLNYHGKCKEFDKVCSWLIRISLRTQKGTWEVRRYNSSCTCLATSISSDHRQLDYHVICARIYSLVRADVAVTIKVLREATKANYGFRPNYKKVWMVKQKAIAQISED